MSIRGVYSTYQNARKDYECWGCGGPIVKGEIYERQSLAWGNPARPFHTSCTLGSTTTCTCSKCIPKLVES